MENFFVNGCCKAAKILEGGNTQIFKGPLYPKMDKNFEGFTQNGCYGNQSQPLEVLLLIALMQTIPALLQKKI